MTAEERAAKIVADGQWIAADYFTDESGEEYRKDEMNVTLLQREIADAIRAAVDEERKAYGRDAHALEQHAESWAEAMVEVVRANTPDQSNMGVVAILATNFAGFASKAIAAERERCARLAAFCAEHDPHRLPALAGMIRGGFDAVELAGPPKEIAFPPDMAERLRAVGIDPPGYTVVGGEQ